MVLGSTVGGQQATLAQDAPRVCVAAMEADTGAVHAIGDLPGGGMAVGADKGLFPARVAGGKLTVAPCEAMTTPDARAASAVSRMAER